MLDTKSGAQSRCWSTSNASPRLSSAANPLPSMGRLAARHRVQWPRAPDADELATERKALSIGVDPAGGYTVQGELAGEWIDALRSNMVLSRAGARTVPMNAKSLTLAKVIGDPTVTWHSENASLADADPTFGSVTLSAKTVVCLVKLSLELSQDSANIETILSRHNGLS
ncbi:MAG: phage major capsid protein [Rhodocyclaceae bacterium]|nr:phage major capsid protein [Rhodocyclaceae bacterium]